MPGAARRIPAHPRVRWSRLKVRWPFLIWVLAGTLVLWLYLEIGRTATVSGIVEVVREEAASIEDARLLSVHVVQGQRVAAGDLLAELDTSVLDAEVSEIRSQLAIEQIQIERQFGRSISEAELQLRSIQLQAMTESNRLEAVRAQIKTMIPLMGAAPADARELALVRAEETSLSRSVAAYPEAIRVAEEDLARAKAQLESARRWTGAEGAAEPVGPAKDLIASIERRREQYALHARHSGTVSRVWHRPGDVVRPAESVVTLVADTSQQVIAFVPEAMAHEVHSGGEAWVSRPLQEDQALRASIIALGPEIVTLPTLASPVMGTAVRGRRVVLVVGGTNDFMPGESVHVMFSRPLWIERLEHLRIASREGKAGALIESWIKGLFRRGADAGPPPSAAPAAGG
jgi:HlyD family secretion protein